MTKQTRSRIKSRVSRHSMAMLNDCGTDDMTKAVRSEFRLVEFIVALVEEAERGGH